MEEYRKDSHTVYNVMYHYVWVTKYRYHVLKVMLLCVFVIS